MMRKAIVPIAAMVVLVAIGIVAKIPWWALLGLEILAAVGGYFYLKNEGKKYQEVADMLQISINTVKTQMGRSFQFLRKILGNHRFLILLFWRFKY